MICYMIVKMWELGIIGMSGCMISNAIVSCALLLLNSTIFLTEWVEFFKIYLLSLRKETKRD